MGALVRSWKGTMNRLLSLLLVLLSAGCGSAGTFPEPQALVTPPPSRILADTDWALTVLEGRTLVADIAISLRFEANTFSGSAGCNRYGGEYMVTDNGSLSWPTIAVTAILCAEPKGVMEQEEAYVDALRRSVTYRLSEDWLELQDAKGSTLLVYGLPPRPPMDPARLLGTAWRLVSMDGQAPLPDTAILLGFLNEKWLAGNAGCQDYVATYEAQGGDLHVPFISMLQADCPDGDRLQQERDYTTLLEGVTGYDLGHGRLELQTDRGQSLLFEPLPNEAQATLEGSVWSLVAFVDENRAEGVTVSLPQTTSVIIGTEITIAFKDEVASGSAGCNRYEAGFTRDQTMVAFGPPAATEKYCQVPQGVMEQEQRYLKLLGSGYFTYQIAGSLLWTQTPDGNALVWTVSVPGTRSSQIPDEIRSKADQIVMSRVGRAFFQDCWVLDLLASARREPDPGCLQDPGNCVPYLSEPFYYMLYSFRVPGQTGVEGIAELLLDTAGS